MTVTQLMEMLKNVPANADVVWRETNEPCETCCAIELRKPCDLSGVHNFAVESVTNSERTGEVILQGDWLSKG